MAQKKKDFGLKSQLSEPFFNYVNFCLNDQHTCNLETTLCKATNTGYSCECKPGFEKIENSYTECQKINSENNVSKIPKAELPETESVIDEAINPPNKNTNTQTSNTMVQNQENQENQSENNSDSESESTKRNQRRNNIFRRLITFLNIPL